MILMGISGDFITMFLNEIIEFSGFKRRGEQFRQSGKQINIMFYFLSVSRLNTECFTSFNGYAFSKKTAN
jgi:hypothetical protein